MADCAGWNRGGSKLPCTWDRKFIYSFLALAIAFRSSGHVTPAFLAVAFALRLAEPTRKRGLEQTSAS
jgi:hypothetical protein